MCFSLESPTFHHRDVLDDITNTSSSLKYSYSKLLLLSLLPHCSNKQHTMIFNRPFLLVWALLLNSGAAFAPGLSIVKSAIRQSTTLFAIDYNDPVVAAEFSEVQPMAFEDVEEELQQSGIRVPPTMNDMEAKLMLVEMRLRNSGKLGGRGEKKRPAKFSSKLEEALWTKPAFKEFYEKIKSKGDAATANVITEYLNVS